MASTAADALFPSDTMLVATSITLPPGHAGADLPDRAVTVARDLAAPAPPEPLDDTPYSHGWTGRHDGGPLPPPRADGMYGHVLDAVLEAKARTEAFMVAALAAEAAVGAASSGVASAAPAPKKARRDGDGEEEEEDDETDASAGGAGGAAASAR